MIGWNLENGNGNNGHMVYPTAPFATPPHAASFSDASTMPMSPNFAIETPKSTGNGMYFALLPQLCHYSYMPMPSIFAFKIDQFNNVILTHLS